MLNEDYDSALKYSRLGFDQEDYAVAFEQKRSEFISNNIWWMLIIVVAIIGVVVWALIRKPKEKKVAKSNGVTFALSTVIHPFEAFYKLKHKGEGSMIVAFATLVLFYVSKVLCDIYSGFSFEIFEAAYYNSIETLLGTVGVAAIFIVVNWGVCVLAQGKGKMREIFMVTCFALIPEILGSVLKLVLTNDLH